jgi:hypothetical protein
MGRHVDKPVGLEIFGECWAEWYEGTKDHFYWCVYGTEKPISRENRHTLKSLGWQLHRHERTNREYWCLPERMNNVGGT